MSPRGFPEAEYRARVAKAQAAMADAGLAALLLTTEPDVRYFTGFLTRFWESPTRPWFLIVPAAGAPVAVIPSIGAALMGKTWLTDIRTWRSPDYEDDGVSLLADALCEQVAEGGAIGVPSGAETHLRMPLADWDNAADAHERPRLPGRCRHHAPAAAGEVRGGNRKDRHGLRHRRPRLRAAAGYRPRRRAARRRLPALPDALPRGRRGLGALSRRRRRPGRLRRRHLAGDGATAGAGRRADARHRAGVGRLLLRFRPQRRDRRRRAEGARRPCPADRGDRGGFRPCPPRRHRRRPVRRHGPHRDRRRRRLRRGPARPRPRHATDRAAVADPRRPHACSNRAWC